MAWKKFEDLENPETDFARWTCVVARYEILKYRRGLARDRFVLDEDLVQKICEEGASEIVSTSKRMSFLEGCLAKLPHDRRNLVMAAYTPGQSVKVLAEKEGKKPDALYQLIRRIRLQLEECIEQRFQAHEGAV